MTTNLDLFYLNFLKESGVNFFLQNSPFEYCLVSNIKELTNSNELSKNIINSLEKRKACLMSNHGQVAFGSNLKQAFELAEEVENICHQYIIALKLGEPKILSSAEMQKILDKVKNYKSG